MPFNAPILIPGKSTPSVCLRCANLRIAFLAFSLLCWVFSLVFLCEMAAHVAILRLAEKARAINDFFGNTVAFLTGPVVILGVLLYFVNSRQMLTWLNGVLIDDEPIAVTHYQFKRIAPGVNLIYLRSATRLWILYPVTSQDNKKIKNTKMLKEEVAYNETQVELLKNKLAASAATEKPFWLLTKGLVISLLILTLIMIVALANELR